MKIGQLIKMERLKRNMKQESLAYDICSTSHLSKIENGTTIPGDAVQQKLLQRLNISLESTFGNVDAEQFSLFKGRFKEVIDRRDKTAAELLCQEIHSSLEENPLYNYRIDLLLMETRLQLMTSTDTGNNLLLLATDQSELSHTQQFHLYIIQGIIAYQENRFTNALTILKDAHKLAQEYRMEDWEMAELHYVLSLAALSDYRYILAIDHAQEALAYFNAGVLATRSIECLLILGIAQKHNEHIEDALATLKSAEKIALNSKASNFLGVIEHNLGSCYSLLNDNVRALDHFKKSLEAKGDPNKQIITVLSIVKEYQMIGNKESAKNWTTEGIALLDQLSEQNQVLYNHHFAIYKALLHDEHDFVSIFKSALHYFEEKQNYYRCFVYCNILAGKLAENNQFKLATTFYQKAFEYHLQHRKVQHWEELA